MQSTLRINILQEYTNKPWLHVPIYLLKLTTSVLNSFSSSMRTTFAHANKLMYTIFRYHG